MERLAQGGAQGSESANAVNVAFTSSIFGVSNVAFWAGNAPSKARG